MLKYLYNKVFAPKSDGPKSFYLVEKDNNTTINVKVGDYVIVTLAWNPSSGYFWQSGETDAGDLEEIKHEPDDISKPGAPVVVSFKFKVKTSGDIELLYARPWSETEKPGKWFLVKVKVK